jgi:hypothetical protein
MAILAAVSPGMAAIFFEISSIVSLRALVAISCSIVIALAAISGLSNTKSLVQIFIAVRPHNFQD